MNHSEIIYTIFNNRSLVYNWDLEFRPFDPNQWIRIFLRTRIQKNCCGSNGSGSLHCFKLSHHYMHYIIQEVNLPGLYNKKIELNCGQLVIERITRMLHCVQDADASQQTFVFPSPLCRRWSGRRRRILRRTDW